MAAHLGAPKDTLHKARQLVDEDGWENSFVLERETGDPNSDGTLAGPVSVEEMPADLRE